MRENQEDANNIYKRAKSRNPFLGSSLATTGVISLGIPLRPYLPYQNSKRDFDLPSISILGACSRPCLFNGKNSRFTARLQVNASRSTRSTTKDDVVRMVPQHLQDLQQRQDLHLKKRAAQYENLEDQPISIQDYLKARDITEGLLEVQAMFIRKLANEENRLKALADGRILSLAKFDELVKEVEGSIQAMCI